MKTNLRGWLTGTLLAVTLYGYPSAYAGPLKKLGQAVGDTAEFVGDTVVDTGKAVGKTVGDTADAVTGDKNYAEIRSEINKTADSSLQRLFKLQPSTKTLFDSAYGYAVFDNRKTALLLQGGSGAGVAVIKGSGARTYMRMATVGANLGLGIQFYQTVFMFEDKKAYDSFVSSGWEANTAANAAVGKAGANAEVKFNGGMAFFQLADSGIMLNASIAGTKYWKSDDLNSKG